VNFLIELAKETNDLDTLKNLCRKLKKASTTLLKEDEGFKEALLAYIEVRSQTKKRWEDFAYFMNLRYVFIGLT
jgi:hypothetical protein